jgi:hypothetical protein
MAKKSATFTGTQSVLPCPIKMSVDPSRGQIQSSPRPCIISFQIHLGTTLQNTSSFLSFTDVFRLKFFMHFSFPPSVLQSHPKRPFFVTLTILGEKLKVWHNVFHFRPIIIYADTPPNVPRQCILTHFRNSNFTKDQTVFSLRMVFYIETCRSLLMSILMQI